jgi:hypothetical protein
MDTTASEKKINTCEILIFTTVSDRTRTTNDFKLTKFWYFDRVMTSNYQKIFLKWGFFNFDDLVDVIYFMDTGAYG